MSIKRTYQKFCLKQHFCDVWAEFLNFKKPPKNCQTVTLERFNKNKKKTGAPELCSFWRRSNRTYTYRHTVHASAYSSPPVPELRRGGRHTFFFVVTPMMLLAIQHSLDECDDVYCRSIIKNLVHVLWGHHTKGLKQVDVVKTTRFFALFDVKMK